MMKKNKEYYTLDNILSVDCQYNVIFGERTNGKSYAVKYHVLQEAYLHDDRKFVYIRRWREDISMNRDYMYWADMVKDKGGNKRIEEITKGEYNDISIYKGNIYLARRDETDKKIRGKQVGRILVLTADTHEKSMAYVDYYNIIYEEFITDKGYLAAEVSTFMSAVSTILRRDEGRVFMVGNTLDRTCPYFREWELTNIAQQKQDTIDKYMIEIDPDENGNAQYIYVACEFCDNIGKSSKLIFGNKMITKGEWYTENKPHLPLDRDEYQKHFSILIEGEIDLLVIELLSHDNTPLLYVRTSHRRWTDRTKYDIVISREYQHEMNVVTKLSPSWPITNMITRLLDIGKVCYEDNLTGTTFCQILKNRKIF